MHPFILWTMDVQHESHCWRDELHSNVHCCHASQHDWVLDPQVFAKRSAKCRVHLSGLTFVKFDVIRCTPDRLPRMIEFYRHTLEPCEFCAIKPYVKLP